MTDTTHTAWPTAQPERPVISTDQVFTTIQPALVLHGVPIAHPPIAHPPSTSLRRALRRGWGFAEGGGR